MSTSRRGFSLMEVLLATSILLGSSIALIELATIGRKQAHAAYDLNIAQLLCQAKIDEILAGIEPVKSIESAELEDDPGWFYSVDVEPLSHLPRLLSVSVTVFQGTETIARPIRFTLVRWVPDDLADPDNLTGTAGTGSQSNSDTSPLPFTGRQALSPSSGASSGPSSRTSPRQVAP